MKILLSPAKTLDYDSKLPELTATQPLFKKQALELNDVLKAKSQKEISELMHLSDKLASLNVERYQDFSKKFTTSNARPAMYAFAGDVYTGLDAYSLTPADVQKAQEKVRILSGMYGYLRPLDLLQPYRLEMGTSLTVGDHKNLYQYWKEIITPSLNKELKNDELVVNLASNEYFKAVNKKELKGTLITPVFKDFKNGKLKVISFFAKKARGSMSRFLVQQDAQSLEDVLAFQVDDYKYSEKDTVKENEPVFIR